MRAHRKGSKTRARQVSLDEEVQVECLVPGGRGLVRLRDGRVAFLSAAVPGDQIRLERGLDKGSFVEVQAWRLLQASAQRVEAACAFAQACGGCDWMHVSSQEARASKMRLLEQALRRTAGLSELPVPVEWVPSAEQTRYRRRIRLHLRHGKLGFLSAKSHDLVEIDGCLVAPEPLNEALEALRRVLEREPSAFAAWSEVELQLRPESPRSVWVHFLPAPRVPSERGPARRGALSKARAPQRRNDERSAGSAAGVEGSKVQLAALQRAQALLGEAFLASSDAFPAPWERQELEGEVWTALRPGCFSQVNASINGALIRQVCDWADRMQAGSFLDLYCGNGNFSLPLLSRGLEGIGVESHGAGLELARQAERMQRTDTWGKGEFLQGDCAAWAGSLSERGPWDLVVVDPPRAGAPGVVEHLPRWVGKVLIMVSCDPVTLARDLRSLFESGFRVQAISAFDMFPQTHHLESCVVLTPPG